MAAPFLTMETPIEKRPSSKADSARRNADSYFVAWDKRTSLVKQQAAAESANNDAKTARLKALRLAKEAADKEAAGSREDAAATSKQIRSHKG